MNTLVTPAPLVFDEATETRPTSAHSRGATAQRAHLPNENL
jgi:hypothetical protein